MTCKACTCHRCRGYATELEQLKKDVGQVAKLQEDLHKLRNTQKTLVDLVANFQIMSRVHGRVTTDETLPYPVAKRPKTAIILD